MIAGAKGKTSFYFLLVIGALLVLLIQLMKRPMPEITIFVAQKETVPKDVYDQEIGNLLNRVVIDPEYSHALEEHPEEAGIVQSCLASRGAYMQFQIEARKRYLRVCLIDEAAGVIGFQIVDIVNKIAKERTAYIKDSIRNIRELLDYVQKMGYPRFKGPL